MQNERKDKIPWWFTLLYYLVLVVSYILVAIALHTLTTTYEA